MFLFLNWNVVIALALVFTDASENAKRQIVLFDDFRKGSLAKSNRLEIFLASSKRKCALRCLKSSKCSSFTFCENRSCQLNAIDAFSDEFQLMPDAGCHYSGKRGGRLRLQYQLGLITAERPEYTIHGGSGSLFGDTTTPLQTTSSSCIPMIPMPTGARCVGAVNNSLQLLSESFNIFDT